MEEWEPRSPVLPLHRAGEESQMEGVMVPSSENPTLWKSKAWGEQK